MAKSKSVIAVAAIVVIIVAAFAVYAGETYPRTIVNTQFSFTIGADTKTTTFNQPFLERQSASYSDCPKWSGIMASPNPKRRPSYLGTCGSTRRSSKATTAAESNCPAGTIISPSEQSASVHEMQPRQSHLKAASGKK